MSERTIKHWMTRSDTCAALGAVPYGKQHRIPRPDNLDHWGLDARCRFKKLGIRLRPVWKRELQEIGKRNARHYLESCRLWVAVTLTALERGDLTQNARDAALLLMQVARKILDPLPRHKMQVDGLKAEFPVHLGMRGFSQAEINHLMTFWPSQDHLKQVRVANTFKELETIRRRLDYAQAVCELERSRQKPTAQLVRPLLHDDVMSHINDTREQLLGIVAKRRTSDELRRTIKVDARTQIHSANPQRSIETIDSQEKTHLRVEGQGVNQIIDLREPQDGLALRTFRRRHPSRQSPQKEIVAIVYDARDSIPGTNDKPCSGKTPVRDSCYPKNNRTV